MNKNSRILIVDNNDVIGHPIYEKLKNHEYVNLIHLYNLNYKNDNELKQFIFATKPEYVFISDINTEYEDNLIKYSVQSGAKKIMNFLRLDEDDNYLNNYNDKVISILIDEVYGLNDNYDYNSCCIFSEIIRRIHESKIYHTQNLYFEIENNRKVNFIFNDDLANACIHIMMNYKTNTIVDLRTGSNINIKSLAELIKTELDYNGDIFFIDNHNYNNYKKINYKREVKRLDWMSKTPIKQGIKKTYCSLIDKNKYFFISKFF
jgi:nucleoside-diphosphate-sugar epimerase